MDLLDSIEDVSAKNFDNYVITKELNESESEENSGNDRSEDEENIDYENIDYDAISKGITSLASLGSLGGTSILSKIKQRLTGKPEELETASLGTSILSKLPQLDIDESEFQDTQPINQEKDTQRLSRPDHQTTNENDHSINEPCFVPLQWSNIDNTAIETQPKNTQPELQTMINSSIGTQMFNLIGTQLIGTQLMDTQMIDNETQLIAQPDGNSAPSVGVESLFLSENEDDHIPMTHEDREAKITRLAEEKRKHRLLREQELEADITHTTLTDEENDLNEANDSVVYSAINRDNVSRKEIEETEKFLNIQRRNINIRPEFERKVVFTTKKLLSAFNDSDEEVEENKPTQPNSSLGLHTLASSPTTSPVKTDTKNNDLELLLTQPTNSAFTSTTQSRNPINAYAQNLRRQLLSSPTRTEDEMETKPTQRMINLDDSDSEFEIVPNGSSPLRSRTALVPSKKITNEAQELATVPELSKDQKFMIKQRFSRKKWSIRGNNAPIQVNTNSGDPKALFSDLRRANIDQLRAQVLTNPEHEILEEREKDEEVMGSLLEREMERVRNIRKKEKLRERAKEALLNKNFQPDKAENSLEAEFEEEQVPDSESGSDVPDSEDNSLEDDVDNEEELDEEQDEDSVNINTKSRRTNKLVISEDEEDMEIPKQTNEPVKSSIPDHILNRHDDSYMFGSSHEYENLENNDDLVTTISTQKVKEVFGSGASLTQNFEQGTQIINTNGFDDLRQDDSVIYQPQDTSVREDGNIGNDSYELFQNLKPRSAFHLSQISQDTQDTQKIVESTGIPVFNDLSEPSTQVSQTQVDIPSTQKVLHTQTDETQKINQDLYDDEDVTPANLRQAREALHKNNRLLENIDEDLFDEEEEEDPAILQQRIKMYEDKIRKNELRARKRRKESEKHGVKDILDGEAQESEDEWHGLGGEDGELSDQANSEDERMIDNTLNLDLKNDEIRKKFMEDYQITDQKELEKLLDDIKNHRLTKKVGGSGLDIELSDEEDELLAAYRRQKYIEQQERLQKNKKMQLLAKNEKVKAFFACLQETPSIIKIDDDEGEEETKPLEKSDTEKDDNEDDDLEKEAPVKKTLKLEASFVQRQLSFLTRGDDEYEKRQQISAIQHGFASSDDEMDVQTLKSRSLSNLTSKRTESPSVSESETRKRSLTGVETDADEDDEFMPVFKKPSYIKSIRSFHEQQSIEIKDGKQFTGVKISREYKVAAGSKAAINFSSGKNLKKQFRGLKVKKIVKSITKEQKQPQKLFSSGDFE